MITKLQQDLDAEKVLFVAEKAKRAKAREIGFYKG